MKTMMIALAAVLLAPACRQTNENQRVRETYKPVESPSGTVEPSAATTDPKPIEPADPNKDDTYAAGTDPSGTPTNTDMTKPVEPETDTDTPQPSSVPPADDTEAATNDPWDNTTYANRMSFRDRARERLDRIDARLEDLEARVEVSTKHTAADLRARRDALAEDLNRAADQAESGWAKFRSRVRASIEQLERDLDAVFR